MSESAAEFLDHHLYDEMVKHTQPSKGIRGHHASSIVLDEVDDHPTPKAREDGD